MSKEAKVESKKEVKKEKQPNKVLTFLRDDTTRFIVGLLFLFIGLLLALSFTSYLCNAGKADASSLANGTIMNHAANNWIGSLGAMASELCINQWLGIAVFLYVLFFIQLGYRLTRNIAIRPLFSLFVHYAVWSIWISLACGFFFVDSYQDSYIYLGGHHGYDLEQYLERLIGWPGVLLLLIITFLILCVFVTRSVILKFRAVLGFVGLIIYKLKNRPRRQPMEEPETELIPQEELAEAAAVQKAQAEAAAAALQASQAEGVVDVPQEEPQPEFAPEDDASDDQPVEPAPAGFEIISEDEETEPLATTEPVTVIEPEPELPQEPYIETVSEDLNEAPVGEEFAQETNQEEASDLTIKTMDSPETVDEPLDMPLEDYDPNKDLEYYQFPTFDLLKAYDSTIPVDMAEQNENMDKIRRTLADYGVEIQSISATVGPTITLFEIVLVSGTKINTIKRLSDEIAMSIASRTGIRIIAPIPGKSAIGIEVPNKDPQTVSMRECIQSRRLSLSPSARPSPTRSSLSTWPRLLTCWWPVPRVKVSLWDSMPLSLLCCTRSTPHSSR